MTAISGPVQRRKPYSRILEVLRGRLRAGDWAIGEPLTIADLARELRYSTTPIREALAYLSGQGVIVDTRGQGYIFPRLDEASLRDAYELHALYVEAALKRQRGAVPESSRASAKIEIARNASGCMDTVLAAALVFEAVVETGANRLIVQHHRALAQLLGRPRRAEAAVIEDAEAELHALATICDGEEPAAAIAAVRRYHGRRVKLVAKIHDRLQREKQHISGI